MIEPFDADEWRATYRRGMAERGALRLLDGISSGEIRLPEEEVDMLELMIDGLSPAEVARIYVEKGYDEAEIAALANSPRGSLSGSVIVLPLRRPHPALSLCSRRWSSPPSAPSESSASAPSPPLWSPPFVKRPYRANRTRATGATVAGMAAAPAHAGSVRPLDRSFPTG